MKNYTETNINSYLIELRDKIKELNSVYDCDIQNGELSSDSVDDLNVRLRVKDKCHVFIDIEAIDPISEKIRDNILADLSITIYIIGVFSKKNKNLSVDAINCCTDIMNFIKNNGDKIIHIQPKSVVLGKAVKLANEKKKGNTFTIWAFPFSQTVRVEN